MHFHDFSNLGLNIITIGLVGTILLTIIQGIGLLLQIKKIKDMGSALSIPHWLYFYFTAHFFCFAIYGFRTGHFSPVFAGIILGSLNLGVFIVAKKKELGDSPEIFSILSIPIFIMVWIPDPFHHKLMGIFYTAGTLLLTLSPLQILKNKSAGAVDLTLQITVLVTVAFWVVYGYAVKDMYLFWNCLISLLIISYTIFLWFKYRKVVWYDDNEVDGYE